MEETVNRTRALGLALVLVTLLIPAACGDDDQDGDGAVSTTEEPSGGGNTTDDTSIATTAELTQFVEPVVDDFDADTEMVVESAEALIDAVGSGTLPAVVIVDEAVRDRMLAEDPELDASTLGVIPLVIVTPAGNPAAIDDVTDFGADDASRTAVCGTGSGLGDLAVLALSGLGLQQAPESVSSDCPGTVDEVAAGDLDAAVMLRSDVGDRDDVEVVDIPESPAISLYYVVQDGSATATAFAAFLASDEGEASLAAHGLLP